MIRSFLLAGPLLALFALPSLAAPFCIDDSSGFTVTLGVGSPGTYTTEERDSFDLMALRQAGVDATAVERWNGCIRAFVRKPGGGEEMQFFQPGNYQRVY